MDPYLLSYLGAKGVTSCGMIPNYCQDILYNVAQIWDDSSKMDYFEICGGYTERKIYHQSYNPQIFFKSHTYAFFKSHIHALTFFFPDPVITSSSSLFAHSWIHWNPGCRPIAPLKLFLSKTPLSSMWQNAIDKSDNLIYWTFTDIR